MFKLLHAHLSDSSVDRGLQAFALCVTNFLTELVDLGGPVGAVKRLYMEGIKEGQASVVVPDFCWLTKLGHSLAEFCTVGRVPVAVIFAAGRVIGAVALSSIPV